MDGSPGLDLWVDDGSVCIVVTNASIIEYEGHLVPGVSMTCAQALGLISELAEHISRAGGHAEGEE